MDSLNKYWVLFLLQMLMLILISIFVSHEQPSTENILKGTGKGFEGTHVMIFIGFGYLMTFLKKYAYSALGFNWLLAALAVQWAMLCQNFFHLQDGVIYINKTTILEADILAATVLITFGALLGLASGIQLIFITMAEIAFASLNFWLIQDVFKASDVGGSIGIHTFGAYFGLGVSLVLTKINRKKATDDVRDESSELNGSVYNSDVFAMLGSIFLWIYWPAFNSGLTSSSVEYTRAFTNTYLSLASAVVTTFFMSSLVSRGKFDMVHVQNSTLAGGVAVGAVCNMQVAPGFAIAIGIVSAILSVLGYKYLTPLMTKAGIEDTCGVHNLHGTPGVLSGLLSVLFAGLASETKYGIYLADIFPAMGSGRASSTQALCQLGALGATLLLALASGILTGLLLQLLPTSSLNEKEKYNDSVNWELP